MPLFENAFNRSRNENFRRRTFANELDGPEKQPHLIYFQKAVHDYQHKNLLSALNNIDETIQKSDIDDWKHYAFKANILEDLQKYDDAITNYEKAIEISQTDLNVYALYHQIGFCYLSLDNDQKASEFYSYAIELKSKHPNTQMNPDQEGMDLGVMLGVPFKRMYNNRANANKNLGKLNEAIEDCNKSLSYDKNYSNPYLMLSQIYSKAGQEDKAIEFLKVSAQLGNNRAISILSKMGLL